MIAFLPTVTRLSLITAALFSQAALAQTTTVRSFDAERVELNMGASGSLVVGSGDVLPDGATRISLTAGYQYQPLVLYENGVRVGAPINHRLTAHIMAAWSAARWLELGVQVPVVAFQKGDPLTDHQIDPLPIAALGASWVQGRVSILRQRDGSLADAAIQLGVKVPGSSLAAYTRDASLSISPRLSGGVNIGKMRLGGEAAFTYRSVAQLGADTVEVIDEIGSELDFSLLVATARKGGLNGELSARLLVPLSRTAVAAEITAGLRYPLNEYVELYAIGGPGLGRTPGIPFFRAMLGAAFTWDPPAGHRDDEHPLLRPSDADHDGLPDTDDGCPIDPGPRENRGCPAPP